MCSLGDATVLHRRYTGVVDDSQAVPYAYLLGDGSTDASAPTLATMNYVGTNMARVTTRPIAINGAGRLKSDREPLQWNGVTASGSGNHTLVLGETAANCGVSDVTNGPGTVGITKTGSSSWSVSGDYDFTGPIRVQGGGLRLSGTKYEWYRLTVMGNWHDATNAAGEVMGNLSGQNGTCFLLGQWALLDDAGQNQILNLSHNTAADGDPAALLPGEAAMAQTNYCYLGHNNGTGWKYVLKNLFTDDCSTSSNVFSAMNCTYKYKSNGSVVTNGMSWSKETAAYVPEEQRVRIVVRLPANANPVTHYDLRFFHSWPKLSSATVRIPRSWQVEGSADGINWDVLHTVISNAQENLVADAATGGESSRWFSNNSTTLGTGYGPYASGRTNARRPTSVASVSVVPGATLTAVSLPVSSLVYDCVTGCGTIAGVTLTADARIVVTNFTDNLFGRHLPVSLENIETYAGRRFPVVINGESRSNCWATLDERGLRICRSGTLIIFR